MKMRLLTSAGALAAGKQNVTLLMSTQRWLLLKMPLLLTLNWLKPLVAEVAAAETSPSSLSLHTVAAVAEASSLKFKMNKKTKLLELRLCRRRREKGVES
jgi:hypothetical protein